MTTILESPVSLFAHVKAQVPVSNPPLAEVLTQIRDGTSARLIAELREAKPRLSAAAYKAKKAKLRCFTPCSTASVRDRDIAVNDKVTSTNGTVHLDFDHLVDLAGTRAQLLQEPSLVFCFVSPSGDGLKTAFAATGIEEEDSYKHAWRHVVEYLEGRYPGIKASRDTSISYLTALCFLSHDPDLFMTDQVVPIEVPPYVQPPEVPVPAKRDGPSYASVASALIYVPNDDWHYDQWFKMGAALYSTGQPWARGLFDSWSQQSPKFEPREQEATWKRLKKEGTVQIDWLTGKASARGWQDPAITSQEKSNYLADKYSGFDKDPGGGEAPQVFTSLTSQQEWPTLAKEALHGLPGEIVKTIMPHTEADPVALLLQLLVYFGAVVGREAYHMVGETLHHTNLSTCLVGATSRGRKGSAFDFVQACILPTDPESFAWSYDNILGGCGSGEGVIAAVRDAKWGKEAVKEKGRVIDYEEVLIDAGVDDKRLLIYEAEFSSVLKVTSREGNLLSEVLRKAWETGNLRNAVKTAPLKATGAHISLIGHVTSDELQKTLTANEASNGFANRILFACVKRHGRLPEGGSLDPVALERLRSQVRVAVQKAQKITAMRRDEPARQAWDAVWDALTEDRPGLVGSLLARSEAQVLRLSMVYALFDGSAVIRHDHLNAALALWQYIEASVGYIFGTSLGDVAADTVLAALEQARAGLSRNHLLTQTLHGHCRADELDRVLRLLQRLGLVTISQQKSGGRGRPTEVITRLPCEVSEVNTTDYVSLSNNAVKHVHFSARKIVENCEINSQTGSDQPAVPALWANSTTVDVPDKGDNIEADVPMREPGDEEDFEEGEI